ncbi:hypothetical protein [Actinomadura macrotermitis]|uniref:hypothetical protein n=1 Tax=Actinomadura macrotermitis TaxID=2585200 RepID=UPI001294E945|nr:hypothetical protein [Actinomadura macrotermitis]
MYVDEAQQALRQIHDHGRYAALQTRPPWWAPAGRAGLILAMAVLGDLDPDGAGVAWAAAPMVYIVLLTGLEEATDRHLGIRLRRTARTSLLRFAEVALMLTVLFLGAWGMRALDVPLPATLAGLVLAALTLALAKPMHRARIATLRL